MLTEEINLIFPHLPQQMNLIFLMLLLLFLKDP